MFKKFEVGTLFEDGKTKYNEGTKFDFHQSGAILILFFNSPTQQEIESVKSGNFEIGFYSKDEVIFLLAKFKGMEWIDAPYSVHLSKPYEFMELEDGYGYGLNICLVDALTGVLKAMRYVGLSTNFSKKFRTAVENQKLLLFNVTDYNKKINAIYGNYSTKDLVDRADVVYKIK